MNKNIETEEKDWDFRVSASPRIPRGENYVTSLKYILDEIQAGKPANAILFIKGSESKATLDHLAIRLRPLGFVNKLKQSQWVLTDFSKEWILTGNIEELARFFSSRLKFFSELIQETTQKRTISELLKIANENYKLTWQNNTQIYDRLAWLIDMGYIEHIVHERVYQATSKGIQYLKKYPSVDWRTIVEQSDVTVGEETIFDNQFITLVPEDELSLKLRQKSIGYIPGIMQELLSTYVNYLEFFSLKDRDNSLINEFSFQTYGIKASSTRAFLTHLKHIGFIEQISMSKYSQTGLGNLFLKNPTWDNLVICWHAKFSFIVEILLELSQRELDIQSISTLSYSSYNFERENISEIRKRLSLLEKGNFIYRKQKKYYITNKGLSLLNKVNVQKNELQTDITTTIVEKSFDIKQIEKLIIELKDSARDSSHPNRLEKVVADIFQYLGFKSEWIGGAGNTDILVTTNTAPKFAYTVNIDAKSTYSGSITDSLVDFDTLKEHKLKHKANYVLIVGINFESSRLIKRAIEHNVGLLDVDKLIKILKQHSESPLSNDAYKLIFQQSGVIDISVLDSEVEVLAKQAELMKRITNCLYDNTEDEFTNGILTERDIYFILKNSNDEFFKDITTKEIKEMLVFLSSPLVDCVGKSKEGFYAKSSLNDASQKLRFYANYLIKY